MDLYYDPIVELLVKNIGITRNDLYKRSGIESKRGFFEEMDMLLANHRVIKEYDSEYARFRYSPKILSIWEFEKSSNLDGKEYMINFLPTSELEKLFEYTNNGTDQEDCLEFELQIPGYKIEEKYKPFFEHHSGLTLDFEKYNYRLWAKFLNPF